MKIIIETIIFSILMVFFGFITSYITDIFNNNKIILFPKHSYDMAVGIFLSSCLVYLLFSDKYIKYKCNK